jgi:hypothetical protein
MHPGTAPHKALGNRLELEPSDDSEVVSSSTKGQYRSGNKVGVTFISWWTVSGICLLVSTVLRKASNRMFASNYLFYFKSCGTISGLWSGEYVGHYVLRTSFQVLILITTQTGDARKHAQLVSLYYSFTADTSTNRMSKLQFRTSNSPTC